MDAVNQSRRGVPDLLPFSYLLLLCGLAVNYPLAATSLFDSKRGALEPADLAAEVSEQPFANSGNLLHELRLDGMLALADHRRVVISGPKGETYRFSWQGVIEKPMAFEGKSADRLQGYRLSSADARSVWLQLPSGTGCTPDPEKGVAACEEGRAKLTLVRRSAPPTAPPPVATGAMESGVQQGTRGKGVPQGVNPALARWMEQQKRPAPTESPTQVLDEELRRENALIQLQQLRQRAVDNAPPGLSGSAQ